MKNMPFLLFLFAIIFSSGMASVEADEGKKKVRVFVALCDNETQGIVKVGKRIGNGNDPDANLYWGCSDGLGSFFKNSRKWKLDSAEKDPSDQILRRMKFSHASEGAGIELVADAYRGSEMRQ